MAILINGIKHACASCIRGHRVKKCNHNDRQLIPVVKRGRQVSQCNHCRDLRVTNKSHVKCTCAIASVPNPINGCLCEVILSCTCVASHLQEVKEDTNSSVYTTSPTLDTSSCCSTPPPPPPTTTTTTTTTTTSIAMAAPLDFDQPTDNQKTSPILLQSVQDDHEDLMNFLINDLDKYLATPHEENTTI